jgi:hypothetical protein
MDVRALLRTALGELHSAGNLGEKGVIHASTDVGTCANRCATLTNQDIASQNVLTAEALDAQSL